MTRHCRRVVGMGNRSKAMVQSAREGRHRRTEGSRPERRAQARGAGRGHGGRGADTADDDRAVPSLRAALTAALRQRVRQRAARDQPCLTRLVGHSCAHCWEAPALLRQPAPWDEEMGICSACHQETPAGDADPR
jgi:hypothetical protein